MHLKILCFLLITALLSCKDNNSSSGNSRQPVSARQVATKNYEDVKYITKVYGSIITENELNRIALERSDNKAVTELATELLERYGKLQKKVEALAADKSVRLEIKLRFDQQNHIDFLKKEAQATFDREYLDILIREHKKFLEDFQLTGTNSYDADINIVAAEVLKVVTTSYAHIMTVRNGRQ